MPSIITIIKTGKEIEKAGRRLPDASKPNVMKRRNMSTLLLSEKALARDWNTKEEDEAWKDL